MGLSVKLAMHVPPSSLHELPTLADPVWVTPFDYHYYLGYNSTYRAQLRSGPCSGIDITLLETRPLACALRPTDFNGATTVHHQHREELRAGTGHMLSSGARIMGCVYTTSHGLSPISLSQLRVFYGSVDMPLESLREAPPTLLRLCQNHKPSSEGAVQYDTCPPHTLRS
ncbi:hypothetical protein UY3_07939 [Chelonia mydas]|uniref:Uncharacterized protein n=1 Tax=Chelonia mydas TaxID=8469 RepID=M7BH16_CHEMY|nr:hypothetical protein UY3_07939 [Chelonia mydas]